MSRLEHSKILELENRTDVIAKDVQRLMDKNQQKE